MGDLTANFSRSEFLCKGNLLASNPCGCNRDTIDFETLTLLQRIRDHFGVPITVHSGNRCPEYNAMVGGASSSQHLRSRAVDFSFAGDVHLAAAHGWIDSWHNTGGLGLYPSFIHLDARGRRVRWTG